MHRHLLSTVLVLVFAGSHAQGEDSDELKKQKALTELLQTKLKLAEKENEALKIEIAALKAKAAVAAKEIAKELAKKTLSDLLPEGAVLTGDYRFTTIKGSGTIVITIKERDGKKVKGTSVATVSMPTGGKELPPVDIVGEINGNRFAFKTANTVGKAAFAGTLKGETLVGDYLNDLGQRAEFILKLSK